MPDISSSCLDPHFIFMCSCNCGGYTTVWIRRDVRPSSRKVAKILETPSFLALSPYYRVQWFCIHLMVRDQWWWLGSCDGCEFCVGTDMIVAVSRHIYACIMHICSCIYSRRRIYAASIGRSDTGSNNIRSNLVGAINDVRRRNSKSASWKAREAVNPDNCC